MSIEKTIVVEITSCGSVLVCHPDGTELNREASQALADCCKPGDAEEACRFVLSEFNVEFWTMRTVDGELRNCKASTEEKTTVCRTIYPDSETDFFDEDNCDLYLIWEASHQNKEN